MSLWYSGLWIFSSSLFGPRRSDAARHWIFVGINLPHLEIRGPTAPCLAYASGGDLKGKRGGRG